MAENRVVVIGGSAGALEACSQLVSALPGDLAASVLVVIHFPPHARSFLARILGRKSKLQAVQPRDGEELQPGRLYVARPDYHLELENGRIRLTRGPRVNGHRPSIDSLFHSAARLYGGRVIGVVLSGAGDDGTAGLYGIKSSGGIAIVQDPVDAVYPDMPHNAIRHVSPDYVLPAADIGRTIAQLVNEGEERTKEAPMPEEPAERQEDRVFTDRKEWERKEEPGRPSVLTCPSCGGVLWEFDDGGILQFRCHVGHPFTIESLLETQNDGVEYALWSTVRILEERAMISHRMANRAREGNRERSAERFQEQASEAEHDADVIRALLLRGRQDESESEVES